MEKDQGLMDTSNRVDLGFLESASSSIVLHDFPKMETEDEVLFRFYFFVGGHNQQADEKPNHFFYQCFQTLPQDFCLPKVDVGMTLPLALYLQMLFGKHKPDMYKPDSIKAAGNTCIQCKKEAKHIVYLMGVNLNLAKEQLCVQVAGITICAGDSCVAEYHSVESPTLRNASGLPVVALYPYEIDGKPKCLVCGEPSITLYQRTYTEHKPRAHIKIFGYNVYGKEECRAKADEFKKKDFEKCVGPETSSVICAACGTVYEGSKCRNCMVSGGRLTELKRADSEISVISMG